MILIVIILVVFFVLLLFLLYMIYLFWKENEKLKERVKIQQFLLKREIDNGKDSKK